MNTSRKTLVSGLLSAAAFAAIAGVSSSATAALIVYEPFNYPNVTNGATMNGVATNATGLGGSYTVTDSATGDTAAYDTAGLPFGNLQTTGGSLLENSSSGTVIAAAPLSAGVTGSSLYGSYLVNTGSIVSDTNYSYASNWFAINTAADGSGNNLVTIATSSYHHSSPYGVVVLSGTTGSSAGYSGEPLANGTTYLVLFQVTGVNGGANSSVSAKDWMLSAAQFANFEGNLTVSNLTAATTGTGSNQVTQSDSVSGTSPGGLTISAGNSVLFNDYNATNLNYDELRLSTTSLADVAPVPEPATLGLVAMGGLGLLLLKRRKAV